MAPEVRKSRGHYSKKADVYSFGESTFFKRIINNVDQETVVCGMILWRWGCVAVVVIAQILASYADTLRALSRVLGEERVTKP